MKVLLCRLEACPLNKTELQLPYLPITFPRPLVNEDFQMKKEKYSPENLLTVAFFVSFSLLLLNWAPTSPVNPSSSVAAPLATVAVATASSLPAAARSRSARQQSRSPAVTANSSPAASSRSQTAHRKHSTWKMRSRARMTRSLRSNGTEHSAHFAVNRLYTQNNHHGNAKMACSDWR